MIMTMRQIELTVDNVIKAWTAETDKALAKNPEEGRRAMSFNNQALKLLAQGSPVSPAQLADTSGRPVTEVEEIFAKMQERGVEVDETGNLVGLALTLNPTPHRFILNGRTLYTWCALDAVFMPGLLDVTAEVESTCPTTGKPIQLTISPDGIEAFTPETAVLSIAVPGLSCRREDDDASKARTGPKSDSCNQMHFFASNEAAELWAQSHPGTAIFTPEEAYRLAYANWIGRR
jgi:alkylmercury lyase